MEFKEFLMAEYNLSDGSAEAYVGRFNGLVKSGVYNGEELVTPSLQKAVEVTYGKSVSHYMLTLERYLAFRNKIGSS